MLFVRGQHTVGDFPRLAVSEEIYLLAAIHCERMLTRRYISISEVALD